MMPPAAISPRECVVVIATAGRADVCADATRAVASSVADPECRIRGIISAPTIDDVPDPLPEGWTAITGARGLAAQRNAALESLTDGVDYVFFFDDDSLPRIDYIAATTRFFETNPDTVAVTGNVILDGAERKREIPLSEAQEFLSASWLWSPWWDALGDQRSRELYGCNFAIRWGILHTLRFDERLPLYSWLEDLDYACRARHFGRLSRLEGAILVHRGSNSGGRTAHRRLGYSQVANPWWLAEKGSFSFHIAAGQLLRPLVKNALLSAIPAGRFRDRRQRFGGNVRAIHDLIRSGGHAFPERIREIL